MGRCAHELVQVESIMYPWGIKVVRTITLLRAPSGYTLRHDSGWRADGIGQFLFHYFVHLPGEDLKNPPPPTVRTAGLSIHPGVVNALYDIHNIVETKSVAPFLSTMNPVGTYVDINGFEQPGRCRPFQPRG